MRNQQVNVTQTSRGIGVCSAFVILFVALKLTGHIDWSWGWVFAPWWIPFALVVGIVAAVVTCLGIVWVVEGIVAIFKRRRNLDKQYKIMRDVQKYKENK